MKIFITERNKYKVHNGENFVFFLLIGHLSPNQHRIVVVFCNIDNHVCFEAVFIVLLEMQMKSCSLQFLKKWKEISILT